MVTPAQCRAARGYLKWSLIDLADRVSSSATTVCRFEAGRKDVPFGIEPKIQSAFERSGVAFVENGLIAYKLPLT